MTYRCPSCGQPFDAADGFCETCGSPLAPAAVSPGAEAGVLECPVWSADDSAAPAAVSASAQAAPMPRVEPVRRMVVMAPD